MQLTREDLERRFRDNSAPYMQQWMELLRFPSVGADPAHDADCEACADWLCRHLAGIGFDARLLPTGSKPVVYGQRAGRAGAPTVLFYGHYDVQPADPLDAWTHPPFEPAWEGDRLYARGAQDNKGQLFAALKAFETLIAADALDATVKIVVEGEEESGSAGISRALPEWREFLAADVLMVADTGMAPNGAPTIVMGLRGVVFMNVALRGPDRDLHSGVHGGLAPNPAEAAAELAAGLHKDDGGIAVDGFLDGIAAPPPSAVAAAMQAPFDTALYRERTGCEPAGGERGVPPQVRVGFRPTLEINGIHAGYGGAGSKTVIPAGAEIKLSARLVPGQDPERCLEALARHLAARVPPGIRLEILSRGAAGPGFRLDPSSPRVAAARGVLEGLSEQSPVLHWEGASIPVVAALRSAAGAEPLLVGFGSEADNIHAPDESFSREQFRLGFLYTGLMLQRLHARHGEQAV